MLTDDLDHFDTPLSLHEDKIDNYSYQDKKIHKAKRKKLDEYLEAKRLREELSDYTAKSSTHYDDDMFSDYYLHDHEEP